MQPLGQAAVQAQETKLRASATPPGVERITFAAALERSLARNPSVTIAEQEILRAEALVRQSQAAWLPTLSANGTYTRLDSDRVTAGANNPNGTPGPDRIIVAKNQLGANLNLAVPLFAPSRWLATSRAGDNVDAQRASSLDVRRQTGLATGRAYLNLLANRRSVDLGERARDVARAHYQYSRSRRTGGVGNRLDEVRAEQELASDESLLQTGLAGLARAREALGVLIGEDAPKDAADEPDFATPPALGPALDEAKGRGDVRAQEARLRAAEHAVRDGWSDYAPLLTAGFVPSVQTASLTQPTAGWQAQLVLSLPLYDGGFRYGAQRERRALATEAKENLDAVLRQAGSDVRAAFEALQRADEALVSARSAARLAGEALQLADLAYRAGAVNNLEVIDAERRARDAEAQSAAAEDASRQGRLELLAASGRFP